MRVGVLTGGGDCPGLNAVIRAVVRRGVRDHSFEFIGFRDGWRGPLEGLTMELGIAQCRGILPRGGTILGSSRTNPFKIDNGVEQIQDNLKANGVDALVAIGGEDTLGVATKLAELGVHVVGVPKTIDNDLSGTDFTFGFDTAVNIATEAIDRLHTTAESHHRVLVVEVMGRHAGWIALHAGIAGGATEVLIPEQPFDIQAICDRVETRFQTHYAPIIVVSEGAVPAEGGDMTLVSGEKDAFGHVRLGGIGDRLAHEIESRTGKEARAVVLGHIQRGGTPTAFDRWLATRFGLHAIDAVADKDFGTMVALRGTDIVRVPLSEGTAELKLVSARGVRRGRGLLRIALNLVWLTRVETGDDTDRSGCEPSSGERRVRRVRDGGVAAAAALGVPAHRRPPPRRGPGADGAGAHLRALAASTPGRRARLRPPGAGEPQHRPDPAPARDRRRGGHAAGERCRRDPTPGSTQRDEAVRLLQTLTDRERRIVVLRHYFDLSEAEVAHELGVARGTVKSTLSRALAKLRVASGTGDRTYEEVVGQ